MKAAAGWIGGRPWIPILLQKTYSLKFIISRVLEKRSGEWRKKNAFQKIFVTSIVGLGVSCDATGRWIRASFIFRGYKIGVIVYGNFGRMIEVTGCVTQSQDRGRPSLGSGRMIGVAFRMALVVLNQLTRFSSAQRLRGDFWFAVMA